MPINYFGLICCSADQSAEIVLRECLDRGLRGASFESDEDRGDFAYGVGDRRLVHAEHRSQCRHLGAPALAQHGDQKPVGQGERSAA